MKRKKEYLMLHEDNLLETDVSKRLQQTKAINSITNINLRQVGRHQNYETYSMATHSGFAQPLV